MVTSSVVQKALEAKGNRTLKAALRDTEAKAQNTDGKVELLQKQLLLRCLEMHQGPTSAASLTSSALEHLASKQGESDKLAAVDDTLRYLEVDFDTSNPGVQELRAQLQSEVDLVRALRQQLSDTARQTLAFTEAVGELKGRQSIAKAGTSNTLPPEIDVSPEVQTEQALSSSLPVRKESFRYSQQQVQGDSAVEKSGPIIDREGQPQGSGTIQRKVSFQEPDVTSVISHPLEKKVSFKEPESLLIEHSPPEQNPSTMKSKEVSQSSRPLRNDVLVEEPSRTPERSSSLERRISSEELGRTPQRSPSAGKNTFTEPLKRSPPERSRSLERKVSLQEQKLQPQRSRSMEKKVTLKEHQGTEQRRGLPEKRVSFAEPRLNRSKEGSPGAVGGENASQIDAVPAIRASQPSLHPLRDPAGDNDLGDNQGDPHDSTAAAGDVSPSSSHEPLHDSAPLARLPSISSHETEPGTQDEDQVLVALQRSEEEGLNPIGTQERSDEWQLSAMPVASQGHLDDSKTAILEDMSVEGDMTYNAESARKWKGTWAKGLLGTGAEEGDSAEKSHASVSEEGSWNAGGGDDSLADQLATKRAMASAGATAEEGSPRAPGQGSNSVEGEGDEAEIAESELAGAFSADLEATTLLVGPLRELRAALEAAERDLEAAEKEKRQLRTALSDSDRQRQEASAALAGVVHERSELAASLEAAVEECAQLNQAGRSVVRELSANQGQLQGLQRELSLARESSDVEAAAREMAQVGLLAHKETINALHQELDNVRAAATAEAADLTKQLEDHVAHIDRLGNQLAAERAAVSSATAAEVGSLIVQLETRISEIAELQSQLSANRTAEEALTAQLEKQASEIEELKSQLSIQQESLASQPEAQVVSQMQQSDKVDHKNADLQGAGAEAMLAAKLEARASEIAELVSQLSVSANKVEALQQSFSEARDVETAAKEWAADLEVRLADSLAAKEAYIYSTTIEASAMRAQISVAQEEIENLVKAAEEAEQLREELTQKLSASLSQDAAAALQSALSLKTEVIDQLTRQCSKLQEELAKAEQNSQAMQPTESNIIAMQEAQLAQPPFNISSSTETRSMTDEIGMLVSDDSDESKCVREGEEVICPAENRDQGAIAENQGGERSLKNSAAAVSEGIDYLQRLVSGISASLDYPPEQDTMQLSQMPSSQQTFSTKFASSQAHPVPVMSEGRSGTEAVIQHNDSQGKSQEYVAQLSRTLSEVGLPPAALIPQDSQVGRAASRAVDEGGAQELSRILSPVGLPAAKSSASQPKQDNRSEADSSKSAHSIEPLEAEDEPHSSPDKDRVPVLNMPHGLWVPSSTLTRVAEDLQNTRAEKSEMHNELARLRSEKEQLLEAYWRLNTLEATGRSADDLASASSSTSPPAAGISSPHSGQFPGALASPAAQHSPETGEQQYISSGSATTVALQPPIDSPSPRNGGAVGQQGWGSGSWISSEDSAGAAEHNTECAGHDSESNNSRVMTGSPVQQSDTAENPLFDRALTSTDYEGSQHHTRSQGVTVPETPIRREANPVFRRSSLDVDPEATASSANHAHMQPLPSRLDAQGGLDLLRGFGEPLPRWPPNQQTSVTDGAASVTTVVGQTQAAARGTSVRSGLHTIGMYEEEEEQETWLTGPADAQMEIADRPKEDGDQADDWRPAPTHATHSANPRGQATSAHLQHQLSQMTNSLAQSRQQALLEREHAASLEKQLSEAQAALADLRKSTQRILQETGSRRPGQATEQGIAELGESEFRSRTEQRASARSSRVSLDALTARVVDATVAGFASHSVGGGEDLGNSLVLRSTVAGKEGNVRKPGSAGVTQRSRGTAATEDMDSPSDEGLPLAASLREPFELRIIRLEAENLELFEALDEAEIRTEKAFAEAQKLAGKLEEAQREAWGAMVAEEEMGSQLEAAQAELQRRHSQANPFDYDPDIVEALVARLSITRDQLEASDTKVATLTSQLSSGPEVIRQAAMHDPLREGTGNADGTAYVERANDAPSPDAVVEEAKARQGTLLKRVNSLSAALSEAHAKNASQEEQLWKFVGQLEDARHDMEALMDRLVTSAQQSVQHTEAKQKLEERLYAAIQKTAGQEAQIWQLVDELMAVREKLQVHESLAISPKAVTVPRSMAASRGVLEHPAASTEGTYARLEHETAAQGPQKVDKVIPISPISQEGVSQPHVDQIDSESLPALSSRADSEFVPGHPAAVDTSCDDVAQILRKKVYSGATGMAADVEPPAAAEGSSSIGEPTVRHGAAGGDDIASEPRRPIGRTSTDFTSTWSAKISVGLESAKRPLADAGLEEVTGDGGRIGASWGTMDTAAHLVSLSTGERRDSLAVTGHRSKLSDAGPGLERLPEGNADTSAFRGTGMAACATLSNSLSEIADMTAQADQGALVKQLSDHVLHLESSLSVANAQIAVNTLDRQSLQNSIESALRDLAAKKLAEDDEDAQEVGTREKEGFVQKALQFGAGDQDQASPGKGLKRLQALQEAVASLEEETMRWRDITQVNKKSELHAQAANGDTNALLASIRKKAANLDAFAATQGMLPHSGAVEYPTFRARSRSARHVARAQATQAFVAKIKSDLQEAQGMLEEALRQAEAGLVHNHSRLGTPRSPTKRRRYAGNDADINTKVATLRHRFKKLEMELADAQAAADEFTYAIQADESGETALAARRSIPEEELFFMPLTAGATRTSISTAARPVGVY